MQSIPSSLTSNSLLVAPTTPRSNFSRQSTRLTVAAKKSGPFPSFRKQSDAAEENGADQSTSTASATAFDFFNKFAGKVDVKSLIPVVGQPNGGVLQRRKDPGTVFVAGATGLTGARIAQTLLRQGFTVRAGVPDLGAALDLARLAADYKVAKSQIAALVGDVFTNVAVAKNKDVEVFTGPSSPARPVSEFFSYRHVALTSSHTYFRRNLSLEDFRTHYLALFAAVSCYWCTVTLLLQSPSSPCSQPSVANWLPETLHKHADDNKPEKVQAIQVVVADESDKIQGQNAQPSLLKNWPLLSAIAVYCIFQLHDTASALWLRSMLLMKVPSSRTTKHISNSLR